MSQHLWRFLATIALVAFALPASANAGIPMLALSWPVQWLSYFPVVAIEAGLLSAALAQPFRAILKPVAIANLVSTLVGVPIAWFVMLLLEGMGGLLLSVLPEHIADSQILRYASFPLFAAWIGGSSPLELKAAFLVLMAVFCWASIVTERWVLAHYLPSLRAAVLSSAVVRSNVASYVVLSAVTVVAFTLTS